MNLENILGIKGNAGLTIVILVMVVGYFLSIYVPCALYTWSQLILTTLFYPWEYLGLKSLGHSARTDVTVRVHPMSVFDAMALALDQTIWSQSTTLYTNWRKLSFY
jgi:hypothetical protein